VSLNATVRASHWIDRLMGTSSIVTSRHGESRPWSQRDGYLSLMMPWSGLANHLSARRRKQTFRTYWNQESGPIPRLEPSAAGPRRLHGPYLKAPCRPYHHTTPDIPVLMILATVQIHRLKGHSWPICITSCALSRMSMRTRITAVSDTGRICLGKASLKAILKESRIDRP
jgi:hypothetical protein